MPNKLTLKKLDSYKYSIWSNDFNKYVTTSTYQILSKYYFGETCLELGCADGYGTSFLLKYFKRVVVVDGSKRMLKILKEKIKSNKLEVIYSMIENLKLVGTFDTIMISHTIDIVDDPVKILKTIKRFAHEKTRIIIEVPNSHSLHRQAGVLMGILKNEHDIGKADKHIGHQKIYDMKLLKIDAKKAGLKLIHEGGFLLKPFPNKQMHQLIGNGTKILKAYNKLGQKYPDLAAEIYVICLI